MLTLNPSSRDKDLCVSSKFYIGCANYSQNRSKLYKSCVRLFRVHSPKRKWARKGVRIYCWWLGKHIEWAMFVSDIDKEIHSTKNGVTDISSCPLLAGVLFTIEEIRTRTLRATSYVIMIGLPHQKNIDRWDIFHPNFPFRKWSQDY